MQIGQGASQYGQSATPSEIGLAFRKTNVFVTVPNVGIFLSSCTRMLKGVSSFCFFDTKKYTASCCQ